MKLKKRVPLMHVGLGNRMVLRALELLRMFFRAEFDPTMWFGCTAHSLMSYSGLFGAVALLGTGLGLPERAVAQSLYDRPLEIRHVSLKPDSLNPQVKRDVSCFTYPHFVVKQVDLGEVGADRLSIIPAAPGITSPCRRAKERNEYVIPSDSWSGYFDGVKSDYAFFNAADGTNGGLGFMVFRVSDRKKLFEDTAEKGIRSIEINDRTLKLRYQRVFASRCSVVTGGSACRDIVAMEAGVASESLSSCPNSYQAAKEEMARMRCEVQPVEDGVCIDKELKRINEQKWDDAPTVIVYEVEADLSGAKPVIKLLSDALVCRPSD
jgi:hypothetical protein